MVAIDTSTGNPVRVGGAALVGGPALSLALGRRDAPVRGVAGSRFPGLGTQRTPATDPWQPAAPPGVALAPQRAVLPATWGVPAYFAGAPFGPPYDLPERTAEWELSADTLRYFNPFNRATGMALRIHPRGPQLRTPGTFVDALFGATPPPQFVGFRLDARM